MATENLKVKITADASQAKAEIGKFKTCLKQTTSTADGTSSKMGALKGVLADVKGVASGSVSSFASLASSLGPVAVAVGAVIAAFVALKAAIKNAIDRAAIGDKIKDDAQKVFMSTAAYQEWGYVLKQNGIEIGALKMGMRKFAVQVANGSDALKKYGITATDVSTAFQQAIFTIQNMTSESEKIAAATELFGTRALELYPILNLTNAETQSLMETYRAIGGTMSNELIAASDACTDSIYEMKQAWGGLKNTLAQLFLPAIIAIVRWITLAIAKISILLRAIFGLKQTFSAGKTSPVRSSASIAKSTGSTANNLKKAAKSAKELKRTLMGIDELTKLAEKATSSSASSGSSGGSGGGGGVTAGDMSDFADAAEGVFSSEMLEKIQKFKEKIDEIQPVIHGVYLVFKGLWELLCLPLGIGAENGLNDIWEGLNLIFPKLGDVKDRWDNFKKSVKEKIDNAINVTIPEFAGKLKTKWENLKKKFAGAAANIGIKLPTWSSLKTKWNNLKKKFTGKTVEIGLKFSAAAADLKKWIDANVLSKIRTVLGKIPVIGQAAANKIKLAKGGILTAPTEALLGEYPGARSNPEIATPQSLMYETMQKANGDLVDAFAQMTRQVIAAIQDKDLSVKIGDEQIAKSAQRGNTAYYNRTGKALLTV